MTQRALASGGTPVRRRAFFGLFDANGWSWATLKALFWFFAIILLLGYLPDRAYYFTVFPTIDLGISAVSPINLCPPSNATVPCPAPPGATLPWQLSPNELVLPAPRTDGALAQAGTKMYFVGGSDGSKAVDTVYVTNVTADGNFAPWTAGPSLPGPRSQAAVAFLSGSIYVIGGTDGTAPTDTVFIGTPDAATGLVASWQAADSLKLPAPRMGAAAVVAGDGLFLVGGADAKGPTTSVWKATLDTKGNLGAWTQTAPLVEPRTQANAALLGSNLIVYGGADATGPTATVLGGEVGTSKTAGSVINRWGTQPAFNLPAPRADGAGFTANGTLYLVGGTDGRSPHGELYWTTPDAQGRIPGWSHLAAIDLPASGLAGGAAIASGSHAFIIGGTTNQGPTTATVRADLAPKPPFFQLGLIGATIPALSIQGEIGQQLGYLAAAGVGTVDFVLLVVIGVAMAHKERTREILARLRRGRGANSQGV